MIFFIKLKKPPSKRDVNRYSGLLISTFLLSACSHLPSQQPSNISNQSLDPVIAQNYGDPSSVELEQITSIDSLNTDSADLYETSFLDGLGSRDNLVLNKAIQQALKKHTSIIESQAIVNQAKQQTIITKANQLLNLSLAGSISESTSSSSSSPVSSTDLDISASLPLDIWGNLGASSKEAHYQLAIANAMLTDARNTLIADITKAWYQLLYSQKFFALNQKQQMNISEQLATIESSYNQGLSEALDVYLARENAETAKVRQISSQQNMESASRALELLLSAYPSGKLTIESPLPNLEKYAKDVIGVPADLLANRADLNTRWLAVLAQDANVASRYAEQFPQFTLNGNFSLTSSRLSSLFKENLAWSLVSSVTQTLFDNGQKQARYELAKSELVEQEQLFLASLQQAFSEVETLLSNEATINEQWQLTKRALLNTQNSFEQVNIQYQNGLANYQQVLDVQDRLFDQQQTELEQQLLLINNRVDLILALGKSPTQTDRSGSH